VTVGSAIADPIVTVTTSANADGGAPNNGSDTSTVGAVAVSSNSSFGQNIGYATASGSTQSSSYAAATYSYNSATSAATYQRIFAITNNSAADTTVSITSLITGGQLQIGGDTVINANATGNASFYWGISNVGTGALLSSSIGILSLGGGSLNFITDGNVTLNYIGPEPTGNAGTLAWGNTTVKTNLGVLGSGQTSTFSIDLTTSASATFLTNGVGCEPVVQTSPTGPLEVCTPTGGVALAKFGDPDSLSFSTYSISSIPIGSQSSVTTPTGLALFGLGLIAMHRKRRVQVSC
jgi:MYXO-CTERM domain-containing protein